MNDVSTYLWIGLAILALGSMYLIFEGVKVHRLFADSIVGKLINILVAVLIIEMSSLGIVCYAFLVFYPKGTVVLIPIVLLWIISLGFAIAGVRSAKQQVTKLVH